MITALLISYALAKDTDICAKFKDIAAPSADMPTDKVKYKDCDPVALYYALKPDYVEARKCAFEKQDYAILMMIYANGKGVAKNAAYAKSMACKGEIESPERFAHIDKANGKFDFCDDAMTTPEMNICVANDSHMKDLAFMSKVNEIAASFTPAQKQALDDLLKALDKFTDARDSNEVELGGTDRAIMSMGEHNIQREDFLESLQKLEKKTAPKFTAKDDKAADKDLNETYKKLMKSKFDPDATTMTAKGIKETQLAWVKYRNGWAKLSSERYSGIDTDAWFTKKRAHMLHGLLKSLQP